MDFNYNSEGEYNYDEEYPAETHKTADELERQYQASKEMGKKLFEYLETSGEPLNSPNTHKKIKELYKEIYMNTAPTDTEVKVTPTRTPEKVEKIIMLDRNQKKLRVVNMTHGEFLKVYKQFYDTVKRVESLMTLTYQVY